MQIGSINRVKTVVDTASISDISNGKRKCLLVVKNVVSAFLLNWEGIDFPGRFHRWMANRNKTN